MAINLPIQKPAVTGIIQSAPVQIRSLIKPCPPETAEQLRLLLVGPAGWGKSHSIGMTFPNLVIVNLDNNIPTCVRRRGGVSVVDVWDDDEREKFRDLCPAGVRDPMALVAWWVMNEGRKLPPDTTVLFENMTRISDLSLGWCADNVPKSAKKGTDDTRQMWNEFADLMLGFFGNIEKFRCNVVMTAHEEEIRDRETNRILNRRWMMPGQKFTPKIPSYFNNIFRQVRIPKSDKPKNQYTVASIDLDEKTECEYYWQIQPDNESDMLRTTIKTNDKFVKAHYDSFKLSPPNVVGKSE